MNRQEEKRARGEGKHLDRRSSRHLAGVVSATALLCVGLLGLQGCAQPGVVEGAQFTFSEGRVEDSLMQLREALAKDPRNASLRVAYLTLRERAIDDWLSQASGVDGALSAGERAKLYRRVLGIDPDNARAQAGLDGLEREARLSKAVLDAQFAIDAKDYATAMAKLRAVLTEDPNQAKARALMHLILDKTARPSVDPVLARALQKTLSIEFKDATLKQVFDVLARTADINFVLDKDIKPEQRTTLSIRDVSVKDALDLLLVTNQLEEQVQGRNTILIYPNTPAKEKDYQPLKVRTFFLANADVEQTANTLKTVLKARDVMVDKAQNAIIMRDTPGALQMAERLIAVEDLPTPETMIEVEVLEINRDRLSSLGVQFPPSLALTPLPLNSGGSLTLDDIRHLRWGSIGASVGSTTINASGADTDVKTLANPRIRVRNRETAKILIGDRVPNITSTATSSGFVSENVQYLDVGLKVEVTPTITIDNEVALKVSLEVSSVERQVTTPNGTTAYQIGTRSASTVLRLKDGENQILAGLINEHNDRTLNKVPGLGDIPIAGRLFSSESKDKSSSEIVLSITPRLIRNTPRLDANQLEFESGTDSSLRGADVELPSLAPVPSLPRPTVPPQSSAPSGGSSPAGQMGSFPSPVSEGNQPAATLPATGSANGATMNAVAPGAGDASSNALPANSDPNNAPAAATLAWSGDSHAKPGGSVRLDLVLPAPQTLSDVTLTLGYDPTVLQVTSVTEGQALNPDGSATAFSQRADPATGQIFITDLRPSSAKPVAAQGALVSLAFHATGKPGATTQVRVMSANAAAANSTSVPMPAPPAQTIMLDQP
jgi:general secretion pathway protein D